ncbi:MULTISPECIES: hypothetical protein [unclassified Acidovorax]|uniref:hypothetical protein n=1 Tax=unclassified Acidovorax TaxID=2684926 RepID=UPI001C439A97|nr:MULTISPECIES: hypothetical protein [unclassified Acidovorax]MBV7427236.1 hypothetical protein [Acidovorax sp. sif0732]MBV7448360.1 hypothetical protein [Acidovorax sp. sif0715]
MKTAEKSDEIPGVLEDESDDRVYFQISRSGLQYVMRTASARAVAVYVALAAGVDHKNARYPRACTHGAKAVENRTGLSRKNSVPELMEELLGIDALQRPPEIADLDEAGSKTGGHAVTCLIDPDRVDDLVDIDQRFLDPYHGAEKRPVRRSVQGVNSDFMRLMYAQAGRRGGRPFTDALLLYCALLGHFDLERHAGVDPRVACSLMSPLEKAGPIGDLEHVMSLFRNDGHCLVLVRETGFPRIGAEYADELFKDLTSRCQEAPEERAAAALDVLRSLGLVSAAHVLWTASPFTERDSAPLATLYVKGGSTFTDGRHLQHEIDAVVRDTDTIEGCALYPRDAEDGRSAFSGSGIYRYIAPEDEVQASVVLTQLRLKHVADSDSHRAGLVVESLRRDGYLAYLRSMEVA